MNERINELLERMNDLLAKWPAVVPLAGVLLIALNFLLNIYPGRGFWIVDANLFLHLGLITSVIGLLLVNVYRK